jgi:salicylate hydroxylase
MLDLFHRRLPEDLIHLDAVCTGIAESAQSAVARFADGSEIEADVIIGADGIHSAVRTHLFGPQAPNFTGNLAWRALIPADRLPRDLVRPNATVWWGPGKHFVHYYVHLQNNGYTF